MGKLKVKLEVMVQVEQEEDSPKQNIYIKFPRGQGGLSLRDTSHILAAGLALLIKNHPEEVDLLQEVIDHITHEFASPKSFNDSYLNEDLLRDDKLPIDNNKPETKKQNE